MRFRQHERAATRSTWRLLALFALVLVALVAAVNAVLAAIYAATFPFAAGWPAYFFETNTALVLLFVFGGCWVESLRLREGGTHVARLAGGREARPGRGDELSRLERRFVNTVQEMAIASGRRAAPAAWVLPGDDAINALAAGWGEADSVVAVTRGALERLTRAELQGVVAHEFGHLVHGDTRLNMRLVGLVWGLQMVWGFGRTLAEPDERGQRGLGVLFGLGLMGVGALGWVAGRLLQAAVSRQREFLADASAVQYTRAVDGIGGALRKIADQEARDVAALRTSHAASLAHLLFAHRAMTPGWRALWRTHPPLAERLRRLYGRNVLPLAAEVLPFEDDEDDGLAVPALAPAMAAKSGVAVRAGAFDGAVEVDRNATPEALRHDPLQAAANFDAATREAEALARIDLWHGPGEWQAAMLALTIDARSEGIDEQWRAATRDLAVAPAVRVEIDALGPAARRKAFALLLQRACAEHPVRQREMRHALMRRWRAGRLAPAAQWRALVIGLQLGPRPALARRASASADLARHAAAAHAATRQLACALAASEAARRAWQRAAAGALAELGLAAPRRIGPAAPRELYLALRVRHVAPMQRPLLLRAWWLAAERSGLADDSATGDALHLASIALDLPAPQRLLRGVDI